MIPVRWRWEFLYLWQEIDQVLMKFVRGHLLVALLVGLLTSTGFFLIGLDFPFLLGMIAGLADIIPYFGPIIGAIPALALAILHSKKMALSVLVVMVVVQQLESNIISPKVLGSSVGLHPLTVILSFCWAASFMVFWACCWRCQRRHCQKFYCSTARGWDIAIRGMGSNRKQKLLLLK